MKHSATPWTVYHVRGDNNVHHFAILDAKGNVIAEIWDEQGRLDMALMGAAPEMLFLLEEFIRINAKHGYEFDSNERDWFKRITAVIATAKGKP